VRATPEFARWPVSNGSSIDVESDHRDPISSGPDLLRLIKRLATDCPPSTAFAGLRTRERRAISERRRKQDVVRATLLRASWDRLAGAATDEKSLLACRDVIYRSFSFEKVRIRYFHTRDR
jgi:hypothetical protein